jgi:predicted  nucleic acid-binding Zn-ribbon protein
MAKASAPPPISIPPSSSAPGGLGQKVEDTLTRFLLRVADSVKDTLSHVLRYGLQIFLEALEPELLDIYGPALREIVNEPEAPEWLKHIANIGLSGKYEGGVQALIGIGGGAAAQGIGTIVNAPLAAVGYKINRRFMPWRMSLDYGMLAARRDPNRIPYTLGDSLDQGMNDARMQAMMDVMERRLDQQSLIQRMLRGDMTADATRDELWKQGWNNEHANMLIQLAQLIPGPGDLISMAVREAWDDEFARLAGTDEGLPAEFVAWAGKTGLSADWCKRYWRAHWQLPSVQMGMEMLHRGVIDDATFAELIKVLDISPYWRDKLKAISYAVPTRVDVRRAYQDGVIDEAKVKRAYLDFGYNEEWATILTKWTVVRYAPEEKDITLADIKSALKSGLLTEAEASDAMSALDVSDEAIGFYISQARYQRAADIKAKQISAIEAKYVAGKIDRAAAASQLTALSIPSSEIEVDLDDWTAAREAKVRQPTYAESRGFYLDDLISSADFQKALHDLGFEDADIALYLKSADADKDRAAKDAIQKAQAEQERLAKAEKATAYQKAVADIDVQLAQQRQIIANAQAALNAGVSDKALRETEDKISQLSEQIAAERSAIAKLNEQITTATNALNAKISEVARTELDTAISDAQTTIAEDNQDLAALNTEIAQAKLALLTAELDEDKATLKENIATWQVTQAQIRQDIEDQHLAITNAQNTLRLYITDEDRQALEATIRDSKEAIAGHNTTIADYQAQQATLRTGIAAALNADTRAALTAAIDDAHKKIAELQVSRAQARVEE